jgi:hypothetical protein
MVPARGTLSRSRLVRLVGFNGSVVMFLRRGKPDVGSYRQGGRGGSVVKRALNDQLQSLIAPIRTRRRDLAEDKAEVLASLRPSPPTLIRSIRHH